MECMTDVCKDLVKSHIQIFSRIQVCTSTNLPTLVLDSIHALNNKDISMNT